MKKTLHIFLLAISLCLVTVSSAWARFSETETENTSLSRTDKYIRYVYDNIRFTKMKKVKYEVFKSGFYGYLNLIEAGKINPGSTLTLCDFTLSSNEKRMWVIDIKNRKALFNSLVAHGMGTGEEYAVHFSNTPDSHQSSLGFYVTQETYTGNNGYSLKLEGVDGSFNNKAYERAVVIHGADYVSEEFARDNQRLGRSHGCPALPQELAPKIIDRIKNGHCLFIYHSSKDYLRSSYWLKNKVTHLPQDADFMDLNFPLKESNKRMDKIEESSEEPVKLKKDLVNKSAANTSKLGAAKAKEDSAIKPVEEKKYSSIIVLTENPSTGLMDTCIVK
ncbi:MAG TPA: murein L,D-transpeptidase catalytic domain family protein [Chitinophagaceae bacterium]|nr:murein L,D-transpeptidase catalytic domain family protein [Chitinophagaceae bacterium]